MDPTTKYSIYYTQSNYFTVQPFNWPTQTRMSNKSTAEQQKAHSFPTISQSNYKPEGLDIVHLPLGSARDRQIQYDFSPCQK